MRALFAALGLIASPLAAQTVIDKSTSVLPLVEPNHAKLPTKLAWSDEFNGSAIDKTKWPRCDAFRYPGVAFDTTLAASTGETQRYDCSEIKEAYGQGFLYIDPDLGAPHIAWGNSLMQYVGKAPVSGMGLPRLFGVTEKAGMLHTYPNYVLTPGSLLKMRVTLPTTCKGRWPAAWGFAYTLAGQNTAVPFAGQEDDIFEANGVGQLKITQHNGMTPVPQVTVSYPAGDFNVWQWRDQADKIVYEWIGADDAHMTLVAAMPAGNINDVSMPLMLNMAGGTPLWSFIGLPDATTPRSCQMLVDYVRIYGK
jgi:hypothetical protein